MNNFKLNALIIKKKLTNEKFLIERKYNTSTCNKTLLILNATLNAYKFKILEL